jgi:nitroreductase
MTEHPFRPLEFTRYAVDEMRARATALHDELSGRRSVREFSEEAVPLDVIDRCIATAGAAPSGAHQQPWTFVVVRDADKRRAIREAAEVEERRNYAERMSDEWLQALEPLGTNEDKPFLETAPLLIVVFRQAWAERDGVRRKNYYTQESVGIALGFLIAALHHAGLATLTHTPSPMGFLEELLDRPQNERAYVLLPVGYPAASCRVPDLVRKPLDEIRLWVGPRD